MAGEGEIYVAGGVESISLVQNEMNKHHFQDEWLHRHHPETYWPMLQTAEYVAKRYEHPAREAGRVRRAEPAPRRQGARRGQVQGRDRADHHQDEGGRQEHRRTRRTKEVTAVRGRGHPPGHHLRGRVADQAGDRGRLIAAGNASQFSDGASACVVMSRKGGRAPQPQAARHLPRLRGRGLRAGRDGHRPGVRGAEAAAAGRQEVSRHRPVGAERGLRGAGDLLPRPLGIPDDRLNVNGGAIASAIPTACRARASPATR